MLFPILCPPCNAINLTRGDRTLYSNDTNLLVWNQTCLVLRILQYRYYRMLIVGQLVSFTFTHNSALLLMLYYYGLASIYAYNDK